MHPHLPVKPSLHPAKPRRRDSYTGRPGGRLAPGAALPALDEQGFVGMDLRSWLRQLVEMTSLGRRYG